MPGLLESLEQLFGGSGLNAQVTVQVEGLESITSAVQALTSGPDTLANLESAIGALPVPPGLGGIAALSSSLGSLSVPSDLTGALAPVLGPLAGLSVQVNASASFQIAASFKLIREIVRLATGRSAGGPSGMPEDAPSFRMPDGPSIEEMRAVFVIANQLLDRAGPSFDAAKILELLQRAASAYRKPRFFLPILPLIDDMMEPLATIASWQSMNGAELSASLAHTIERVAELMRMPRKRVAQPIIDAAAAIGSAQSEMAAIKARLVPVLVSLGAKVKSGSGQPSTLEVTTVEESADLLAKVAAAIDPSGSPLARFSLADEELTRTLLAVIRALEPGFSIGSLSTTLQARIAEIPAPPSAVIDEAVAGIEAFDLSVLTDPLQSITETVRDVVERVEQAKETVRQALESALSPVADALDTALEAAGFNEIRAALEALPDQIQQFMETQIAPNLESIRSGVSAAVDTVSTAADQFNPEALIAPIRKAVEDAAALLQDNVIRDTFAQLEQALNTAIQAIESIDLSIAADQSIDLIGGIEAKLSEIDPASIPEASKPLLSQAVQVVTNIEFSVEVGAPVLNAIENAVEAGPVAVLSAIEEGMDALRAQLENFRPSAVIGAALDKPFQDVIDTLRQFKPSDLLNRLQDALNQLAGRLSVLDVGAVVEPLVNLHASITTQVEALRPSNLLRPVNAAIAAAIEKVYEATGIDTVFAGINEVLDAIQMWTGLLADARDLLARGAAMFGQPGDATASVRQFIDDALAKLDQVDMARLQSAFDAAASAAASIDRDAIARDLAGAFQTAGRGGPALLASSDLDAVLRAVRGFPLAELRGQRETPSRDRLALALGRVRASADRLDASRARWNELGPDLNKASGEIQGHLLDYYRVTRLEASSVFHDFLNPPRNTTELREAVRAALDEGLSPPLITVLLAFQAISPYVRLGADGLSRVLGAIHAKIDSIVGGGGVGGTVDAIEDAANLLRGINLQPVIQPLDAIYARIETALAALNPEPLRATLIAARDAIASLLNVTTLIDQGDIDQLDQVYATALNKIDGLAPSVIVSETLDPVYEDLLADFLPVLDLPVRLRLSIEAAGRSLREDAERELARVEVAFDNMLRAIPLDGGGAISGSVSVSVSAGVG